MLLNEIKRATTTTTTTDRLLSKELLRGTELWSLLTWLVQDMSFLRCSSPKQGWLEHPWTSLRKEEQRPESEWFCFETRSSVRTGMGRGRRRWKMLKIINNYFYLMLTIFPNNSFALLHCPPHPKKKTDRTPPRTLTLAEQVDDPQGQVVPVGQSLRVAEPGLVVDPFHRGL